MRLLFLFLAVGCSAPPVDGTANVAGPSFDASDFTVCAACHLDTGVGIPGAFPPLRNRSALMAVLDGGREYLITTVSYGIMGTIQVDGQIYAGVMPGHAGSMQAEAIAAALNYLVLELNDDASTADNLTPFSADEVSVLLDNTVNGSPITASRLRDALVLRHGNKWPK